MISGDLRLILADDDKDDCLFFKEVLEEIPLQTELTTVHNGVELIKLLSDQIDPLPSLLFLDLNMPLKNGFECLQEIKRNKDTSSLPVIIFSTSFEQEIVDLLYKSGAFYYIRKPSDFSKLKQVIHRALTLAIESSHMPIPKDNFVLKAV